MLFRSEIEPVTGAHLKRWQTKTNLWLTAMGVHGVAADTHRARSTYSMVRIKCSGRVFVGDVLSVLGDKLVDAYSSYSGCQ